MQKLTAIVAFTRLRIAYWPFMSMPPAPVSPVLPEMVLLVTKV